MNLIVLSALMLTRGVQCSVPDSPQMDSAQNIGNHLARGAPVEPRIIGGFDAYPGQFPWQVSIWFVRDSGYFAHMCGGSILDKRHVVTAAHCYQPNLTRIVVKVGVHQQSDPEDPYRQTIEVSDWVVHPLRGDNDYDVAVMTLSQRMDFNERVEPIYLPDESADPTHQYCVTSGWGMTDPNNRTGADVLQGVYLRVLSQDECRERIHGDLIDDTEICVENKDNKGGCMGDSGGPLVCYKNLIPYLTGIVSWGPRNCAVNGSTTVYCRVTSVLDFITEQIHNK